MGTLPPERENEWETPGGTKISVPGSTRTLLRESVCQPSPARYRSAWLEAWLCGSTEDNSGMWLCTARGHDVQARVVLTLAFSISSDRKRRFIRTTHNTI